MAIEPAQIYPGRTASPNADYPLGSARNVSAPAAGDGTPLEAAWLNDLWGLLQSLLDEAEISASGNPDKVGASQYLQALEAIAEAIALAAAGAVQTTLNAHTTGQGTNVHGLGTMSTRAVGTGGTQHRTNTDNDGRFTQRSNNLSDLASAGTARTNLGLGADTAAPQVYAQQRVSLGGGFGTGTGSEVVCVRIGSQVTITSVGPLIHSSATTADSAAGAIPSQFRPSSGVAVVAFQAPASTTILTMFANGQLRIQYRDHDGNALAQAGTAEAVSIPFNITANVI